MDRLEETDEYLFRMVEEGLSVRLGGRRFNASKLHRSLRRAVQFLGIDYCVMIEMAQDIAYACDIKNSNTIADSAFRYLRELNESQGHYTLRERHTQPREGTEEYEVDREMLYEVWAPVMVSRDHLRLSWRNKPFMGVLARWMRLFDTQDLMDLASALLDAEDRGLIVANQHIWEVASQVEFRYDWEKVISSRIAWCISQGVWEGKTKLELVCSSGRNKKKISTGQRAGSDG